MSRDEQIQHIYRWYGDEELLTLCWGCGMNGDHDHAETPDQAEELECEECGAMNEQAAIWRVGMFNYNLGG